MAKGNMFVGTAKGKVGNLVLSKFHGEQVTKAYQGDVKNPQTFGQMYQRARFANAVKFYKRAMANFFPFAFEDKKKTESDFNAFMRHNVENALIVNRANYLEPAYPALGNNWRLADGSLVIPHTITFPEDGGVVINLGAAIGGSGTTIGDVSEALIKGGAATGDIFTFVLILQTTKRTFAFTSGESTTSVDAAPQWSIMQFIIDANDTTALTSVATKGNLTAADGFSLVGGSLAPANSVRLFDASLVPAYNNELPFNTLAWAAAIISRKTSSGGLLVTRTDLTPNAYAYYVQNLLATESYYTANVESWQGSSSSVPSAVILKGGVANGLSSGSEVSGTSDQAGGSVETVNGYDMESGDYTIPYGAQGEPTQLVVTGVNLSKAGFSLSNDNGSLKDMQVSVNNLGTQATIILTYGLFDGAVELRYGSEVIATLADLENLKIDDVVPPVKVDLKANVGKYDLVCTLDNDPSGLVDSQVQVTGQVTVESLVVNSDKQFTIRIAAGSSAGSGTVTLGGILLANVTVNA